MNSGDAFIYSVKSTVIKFLMFERDNRKIEKEYPSASKERERI
mgnify:CR=1 FL=1